MKDYERYMNRQKVSEIKMAQLVKLEETGRKGVENRGKGEGNRGGSRGKHVPQWVKYCGMAACLAVAFGVFALAILQGGGGIAPNPIANATATPAAEELYFNEVDEVPFTRKVTSDGSLKMEPLEIADVALLFGSSEEDFPAFLEDMGWGKFNMEYYWVDMGSDTNALQVLLRGDYVPPLPEEDTLTSFTAGSTVWLQIYEGYSYIGPGDWEGAGFTACQVNGHKVIAACDRYNCQAGAVFDVERDGKTYGVRYTVTSYGEEHGVPNARELVTRLVRRVTKDGLFPETYGVSGGTVLRYAELTQANVIVDRVALAGETNRPLTREELEAVYPVAAGEDGVNYIWYGTAYYKADGNLRLVSIQGDKMDETASVNIVIGETEADVFTRNLIEKDGKHIYFGEENSVSGLDLLRCFYVNEPGYFNAAANAYHCYAQYQIIDNFVKWVGYVQVRTCVEGGSLLENEIFNDEWLYRTTKNGLWFSGGTINGKAYWDLPKIDKQVELLGSYQYVEMAGEDMVFCPVMVFYADGSFHCASDLVSSHICEGHFTVKDGRVTANCERHRYVFDIIDENNLRFVAEGSDEMPRYLDPKVTDGAVFRRMLDDEGNTVTPDGDTVVPAWNQADTGSVELNGTYYMESEDGDALGNCAKVTVASGKITIASERLNYHTCTSTKFTRETENGTPLLRVVCDKCGGIYSFEIIDGETLRFDMDRSAVQGHHSDWTFEVSHGTTFRHLKDGETTTTLVVWGETTHHPEPSDHVEANHHEDEHHSSSHH